MTSQGKVKGPQLVILSKRIMTCDLFSVLASHLAEIPKDNHRFHLLCEK